MPDVMDWQYPCVAPPSEATKRAAGMFTNSSLIVRKRVWAIQNRESDTTENIPFE